MLPSFSLAEAAIAITTCLAANQQANVDRIDRKRLDALSGALRDWLSIARSYLTPEWEFGSNTYGPSLDDVIRQCEEIRKAGLKVAA